MPEISVIVPVYNVEKYLSRCIDSILAQTFTDFELILVDDGSPDNCGFICDEYAAKDERILVIHKGNGGVSKARNVALDIATGKIIFFCDSDDYLKNDYLAVMLQAMYSRDSDSVACNFTIINEQGDATIDRKEYNDVVLHNEQQIKEYILNDVLQGKVAWGMCSRLYKKDIIDAYNLRICENCENFAEDLCFFLTYLVHCKRISSIDYAGYYYFQRSDSMMGIARNDIKLNALNEVSFYFYHHLHECSFDKIKKNYYIIHFLIIHNQYEKVWYTNSFLSIPTESKKVKKKKWYRKNTLKFVLKYRKVLPYVDMEQNRVFDYRNICFYSVHKNYNLFRIASGVYYKFWRVRNR